MQIWDVYSYYPVGMINCQATHLKLRLQQNDGVEPILLSLTSILHVSLTLRCPISCEKWMLASHETNCRKKIYQEALVILLEMSYMVIFTLCFWICTSKSSETTFFYNNSKEWPLWVSCSHYYTTESEVFDLSKWKNGIAIYVGRINSVGREGWHGKGGGGQLLSWLRYGRV